MKFIDTQNFKASKLRRCHFITCPIAFQTVKILLFYENSRSFLEAKIVKNLIAISFFFYLHFVLKINPRMAKGK